MSVKVSPKFQVVIPTGVRETSNIYPGLRVDVIAKGGVVYLVPIRPLNEIKDELRGKLNQQAIREKKDRKL